MTTKEKILFTALELFNTTSTQAATTNHIAKAADMSAGNLHYHYKNREEIIRLLYSDMHGEILHSMQEPLETILALDRHFSKLTLIQWKYRFFHKELLLLLSRDQELQTSYINDNLTYKSTIITSLQRLTKADYLNIPYEHILDTLADQLLLTLHFWIAHEQTLGLEFDEESANNVTLQIRAIFRPYLTKKALTELSTVE